MRDAKNPLTTDSVMSGRVLTKSCVCLHGDAVGAGRCAGSGQTHLSILAEPLPDYSRYSDLAGERSYKKITSRMLLDHTSGFSELAGILKTTANYTFILCQVRGMHIRVKESLCCSWSWEEVTHKGLEELMDTRVFGPLGMTRNQHEVEPEIRSKSCRRI